MNEIYNPVFSGVSGSIGEAVGTVTIEKPKRKVICICASGGTVILFYALCNDGTVWVRDNYGSGWGQIEEIPQP